MVKHEHFAVNPEGRLTLDGYDLVELADSYGTPLYVVSEARIREKYRQLHSAFRGRYEKVLIAYAVKANFTLAVVRILAQEGAGAEVLPGGEVRIALSAGIPPEKLVLTGNNKTGEDFTQSLKAGVGFIVVDSLSELRKLDEAAGSLGKTPKIMVRVNPSIQVPTHPYIATAVKESKFGVDIPSGAAFRVYEAALRMKNVETVGVHFHIGSQILSTEPFTEAVERVLDFVELLKEKLGFTPTCLDFGGGYGIPYKPEDPALAPEAIAEALVGALRPRLSRLGEPLLILEPGRCLVGDSEVLLARVGNVKDTPAGKFASVDASTNLLPGIFTEFNRHYEAAVANKADRAEEEAVHFSGPLCFAGDILAKNRRVPRVEEGDIIAFLDVGAYCQVAASTFNAYPRPPTLLLSEHGVELIQRRETYEDIVKRDILPSRLTEP
ncbi:diaminopimelate decarboxylase [Candidatus Hecatella orcuttiae]|jgi:diaminopimelate decarboxylase|uniref:diaminopimelate decarboxylase n=1 Tax=Candidatus Hecatella orcuttiae TaxID=1935119 RepID=UPI002867CDA5|nr:diaminopimelate decarboxylase [Candidatus Hecatella orcuttiae]